MGLRTASVRRPYVEVMAPALTETSTNQTFKLDANKDPINQFESANNCKFLPDVAGIGVYEPAQILNGLSPRQTKREVPLKKSFLRSFSSDSTLFNFNIMSNSPPSMDNPVNSKTNANNKTKMGLEEPKTIEFDETIRKMHVDNQKSGSLNEVDQILNNLTSNLSSSSNNAATDDEFMQVLKSIDENAVNNQSNDIIENDIMPTQIENFFLNVDNMMNISIEDQPDMEAVKETHAKEAIDDLKKRQTKMQRRLEFLKRKIYKLQARGMGEHTCAEIGGVFELVNRSLKRLKEPPSIAEDPPTEPSSFDGNVLDEGVGLVPPLLPSTPSTSLAAGADKASDKYKLMSYGSTKTLLKKLEMAAALQASSIGRQKHLPKYFGSGSCDPLVLLSGVGGGAASSIGAAAASGSNNSGRNNSVGMVNVPSWTSENRTELDKVAGLLYSELSLVQHEVDSEATESSSGGESCDEMQNYNNPHQQYLPIQKRALWKYSSSRASIAAKWTWLQAQISYLEYRIRQHTDLHRQIRAFKGEIQLGDASTAIELPQPTINIATSSPNAINGYRGQLPGNSPVQKSIDNVHSVEACDDFTGSKIGPGVNNNGACSTNNQIDIQCARTRPLLQFKKRKLLTINGLHIISKKAARPSNVRCGCVQSTCAICTGRTDPTYPRDPNEALSKAERIALVDPGFHPVLSMFDDVSYGLHCDAIMKTTDWQQRSNRMKSIKLSKTERSEKCSSIMEHRTKKLDHRKKYNRGLLKPSTVSALSAKLKNKIRSRKMNRNGGSFRKRSLSKGQLLSSHSLCGNDGIDEELESIGNNCDVGGGSSTFASLNSSPLLHMQAISGHSRRNRANSYDIDNIVIPYSVAASTRVEKLQYKEILTPKWRIAENEFFKCDSMKNNGVVSDPSQDSDVTDTEDLSEEAVRTRHEKSEHDEKKKFLSYLKFPLGHRSRANKRTDSLAESSGANTPDPLSPQPSPMIDNFSSDTILNSSPIQSPPPQLPSTPTPPINSHFDEQPLQAFPSINVLRRRTISQSRFTKDRELTSLRDDSNSHQNLLENYNIEIVPPYDTRTFPIAEDVYDRMLKNMPDNHHQFQTNIRSQDSNNVDNLSCGENIDYFDEKVDSPGSESTESALGDEDPNDPEWIDIERSTRERHKR